MSPKEFLNTIQPDQKKEQWSFSKISVYRKCPYKYYLQYIRKIYLYKPSNNLVFGNAFGKFLEEFGKNKDLTLENCIEIYWKTCKKHKYRGDEVAMEELKKMQYIVEQYYNGNKRVQPLILKGRPLVEYQSKFRISDHIFTLAIDIIDENYGIMDYKTSKNIYEQRDLEPTSEKGLQLMIYALGFLLDFKKIPEYIGFQVIVKEDPIFVHKIVRETNIGELKEVRIFLEKTVNDIINSKTFKKKKSGLCDYCDYSGVHCGGLRGNSSGCQFGGAL